MLLAALAAAAQAASPLALKSGVDALGSGVTLTILLSAIAYAGLIGIARLGNVLVQFGYTRLTRQLERAQSEHAYSTLISLPHAFFLQHRTGEIARVVTDGVAGFTKVLAAIVFSALPFVVEIGVVLVILSAGAFPATLILSLAFFVAVYGFLFERGISEQRSSYREGARTNAEAIGIAQDALQNHEAIKLFARESHVLTQVAAGMEKSDNHWRHYARQVLVTGAMQALIVALALGSTLFLAGREVAEGRLTAGDFVLISVYVLQVLGPVERLGHLARELARGLDLISRLRKVLSEPSEKTLTPGRTQLSGTSALSVQVRQLVFSYGDGREVLKGVDFDILPGRSLAVVGGSGSGKSTLARLLFRLYPATSGCISINDVAIDTLDLTSLREAIAIVPQETVLFHDTIFNNVAFSRPGASSQEVKEAASIAGLAPVVEKLPDGWQTVVGERGLRLSGGERQRVAIARAVLKRPRLLVLDEATASLDTKTERLIQDQLDILAQGISTLMIAHRLSTIRNADEIVVLEGGEIIERGDHAALLRMGGRYAALWNAQSTEENSEVS